eukprot:TRINITY_DN5974_c0_g2_i1.p1 TRINITY_DN5974_c0_g2~~TRINITY_DN5974_c0_g2_i1.p1  ORF type:complete len:256 (+),score=-5.69 TRINITY_DN5974_c0_g2_i1:94-861(+)
MEGLMCDITSFCTTTFDPLIAQSVHLYSNPKRRSVDPKTDDAKEVNWFMTLPKDIIVVVCNNLNHLDVIHLASSCKSLSAILQDPRILNRGHIHALFFPGVNGAKEMRKIPWMIRSKRNHFIDSPKKPFILRNTIESKFWQWEQTQNQQIGEQLRTDRKQLQLDSQVYAFGDLSEHLSQLQHTYATQIPSEIVNWLDSFVKLMSSVTATSLITVRFLSVALIPSSGRKAIEIQAESNGIAFPRWHSFREMTFESN